MNPPNRIEIRYCITFDAPFHMGTGISAGLIDRTVIRDNDGYLYVPASTFKGALREHCEQLCRFYLPTKLKEAIVSPHDANAVLADFSGQLTPVSRIFGSQLHPGKLRFNDAEQTSDAQANYNGRDRGDKQHERKYIGIQTSTLTQVRIDRLTHTAADGALYTSEFGIRGLFFEGLINGWLECTPVPSLATKADSTTPTYSLLLLLASLQLLEQLGGNKSTGKGRCTCTITELKINKQIYSETQWRSWLEHLDVLASYA